jgi:hypothetical protein
MAADSSSPKGKTPRAGAWILALVLLVFAVPVLYFWAARPAPPEPKAGQVEKTSPAHPPAEKRSIIETDAAGNVSMVVTNAHLAPASGRPPVVESKHYDKAILLVEQSSGQAEIKSVYFQLPAGARITAPMDGQLQVVGAESCAVTTSAEAFICIGRGLNMHDPGIVQEGDVIATVGDGTRILNPRYGNFNVAFYVAVPRKDSAGYTTVGGDRLGRFFEISLVGP